MSICLFVCCSESTDRPGHAYFDTKSFFENEMNRLKQQSLYLEKEMTFGDKQEVKLVDTVNWEEELAPFAAVDLLKPSYQGMLAVDSITLNEHQYKLVYTCDDKRVVLKRAEIVVDKQSSKPVVLLLIMKDDNTVYHSEKELQYYTDSAFSIEGHQKIRMSEGVKYTISARLIKNM